MLLPFTLQSTWPSSSVSLIFLTRVPRFRVMEEPFTFRSLITVTESPSLSFAPLLSFVSMASIVALFWDNTSLK